LRHHRRSQPAISCLGAFRPPATGVRGETVIPAGFFAINFSSLPTFQEAQFCIEGTAGLFAWPR